MKVQTLVSTEDGEIFDIKICTDDIIFSIIELNKIEVFELIQSIQIQLFLLEEEYKKEK